MVDAQIEAYRAKDVERFLSHYADDASVVLFDGTPMFADKQAMREQYGKLFADNLSSPISTSQAGPGEASAGPAQGQMAEWAGGLT